MEPQTSHGDIMRAIGHLEGKIEGMLLSVQASQSDITKVFERLNRAEQRIAQGVIIAAAISLVLSIGIPVLVTMTALRLEAGLPAHLEK